MVAEHGLGPTGVFLGTFTPKLDEKGRLILPAKFRGRLGEGLVMTRGLDRCIFVFPIDEFNAIHDRLRRAPLENKNARDYLRNFLGFASDEIPDKQGRVMRRFRAAHVRRDRQGSGCGWSGLASRDLGRHGLAGLPRTR